MFEAAELGRNLTEAEYQKQLPKLRSQLLNAHFQLRSEKFTVLFVIAGADGAGKGELVHRLNEWLDPRGVETHAFWEPSDEERERPPYWRFWRAMPAHGRIGILFGSWYSDPIIRRVYSDIKSSEFDIALDRIASFEQMLADDGALLLKIWLHMPKKEQKKRLKKLEKEGRIAPGDWEHFKLFDKFIKVSERAIRRTDTSLAPWHVIEATDRRYCELHAGTLLLQALQTRFHQTPSSRSTSAQTLPRQAKLLPPAPARQSASDPSASILDHIDLTQQLSDENYSKMLDTQQNKLSKLAWAAHQKKKSIILVFEGWDAAGKGSAIRRVTQAIDPRLYRAIGVAAPTDEERAHHYLWRFWRHLPRAGFFTIFDRSWYGRVLVERVEGFSPVSAWSRAYHEINDFEEQLADYGFLLSKFWIHISKQEQLRRFKERQSTSYKQYKITEEDWRNRKKWSPYKQAVEDMVARCSTEFAPWTLVAGNDKKFARIQILKTIVKRLEAEL